MLVIARKENEKLVLFDPADPVKSRVEVLITRIKGKTARVGIEAQPHIRIMRAEIEPHDLTEPQTEVENANEGDPATSD